MSEASEATGPESEVAEPTTRDSGRNVFEGTLPSTATASEPPLSFAEYVHVAYTAVENEIEDDCNQELPLECLVLLRRLVEEFRGGSTEPRSRSELIGRAWYWHLEGGDPLMHAADALWEGYDTTSRMLSRGRARSARKVA